ncbi:aminopeptidase N [Coregonus clupeaformis]|uniref:aminopeptidase N n=1 Tax=Coregonus clupeaformis TaxID=59861 RepID=UPI001BDFAB14|nr:aminopeptidase N [Coregonus clupeaformis]XP_041725399.1 aminopeptidase N [Coregonus clupeaformis]
MAKGFYISKNMGLAGLLMGTGAVVTIIALAAVYHKEKTKNQEKLVDGAAMLTTASPTPSTPKDPWDHYRLPDSLSPVSYNITLWPRLVVNASTGLYVFTGQSAVVFQCKKDTDLILIHSNKLNLTLLNGHHARLTGLDGSTAPTIKKSWLQVPTQFLVIQLDSNLMVGRQYELYTDFIGELADDLGGFYRSEYTEDGVKKVVATSQMQATYARKAFPCFDEPAMKAVFHITLIHHRGTAALSNGRDVETVNTTIDGTEVTMTRFEPTKRMSTYLLAVIVSDFAHITGSIENNNVLVRIWGRKKAIAEGHGDYALSVTGPMLKFYERYYNASYPLSKSDQIALPDFSAGAMENWGLITYRETALLYDPAVSSVGNKERVTTVVAHELAHMWFGNLVTLRWWNDLWLNEGFASYVEYLGADYAEPTWNIKEQIILSDVHKVFAVDALASSHPLSRKEEEVNRPAEISEMFNTISYSKGAAVLRMLSEFLTEPVFARGLSSYLNEFAFNNTVYSDLWDHLQKAVITTPGMSLPHTVHDIMNRWILQMGFPVVTIDTATGHITQKHFLLDPDSVVDRPSPYNYTWLVPIKWMKGGVEREQHWLLQKTDRHLPMRTAGSDWLLANLNVSGYYRVNYDMDNWERLLNQLTTDHTVIPLINRAQIVDDAFNLARAKVINTTLALRTTRYLSQERDYIPWESALRNLNYYILMFDRGQAYGVLQAYLKMKITPLFEHFRTITDDWTRVPTGHNDQYNQINAISFACRMGLERCRALTSAWFREWMLNPDHNPIHPNLKTTVYCNAIAAGGVEEWDFAWRMFKNATVATEAAKLRSALACTKVPWLLNRYLDYSLDPAKIRKQDSTSTIGYIAGNVVGTPLAWDFIRARWNYIYTEYGGGSFSFSNLLNGVTRRFSTEFELKQLKQFKEDNAHVGFGSGTLALEQAIEKTTANIKWVAENQEHVMNWFTNEST